MHSIPTTTFGHGGPPVTRVGLGGEGVLRTPSGTYDDAAQAVLETAQTAGISYYDTAPAYDGSQAYLGAHWRRHPGARQNVFHTSKSARRDADGAKADLVATLAALGTDYLDLWQLHDVRTMADVAAMEAPGGALSAFVEARESGLARHIGVTGHHDPAVLTHCVKNWPVNSVLLPVNPLEGALGGFLDTTLPAARERGLAVVGMKALGGRAPDFGGNYVQPEGGMEAGLLLRYALSQPVDVLIVGCAQPDHVAQLAAMSMLPPMEPEGMRAIEAAFAPYAKQLAFYRGNLD